mmetsp:Transcript_11330/g.17367  ORF Transcript_11330/g.17367 Transcript_11330/m.17367 type:complete len:280 (+) Transcript_11330:129-968(+)
MILRLTLLAPFLLRSTFAFQSTSKETLVRKIHPLGNYFPWEQCQYKSSSRSTFRFQSNGSGGDNNIGGGGTAQDLSELFDVYHPPSSINSVVTVAQPTTKTGQTKRRLLVHQDGDWHRSVHIWVVDKDQEHILLQRRSGGKDTFPNCLDVSCAGHVTSGDDIDETAIRELEEELGMNNIGMDLIKDSRAFTFAASIVGETPLHGKFICQEYQEVFVLRQDGELDVTSFAPIMKEEVAGFEVAKVKDILSRLEEKDEMLVPRSTSYIQALAAAILGHKEK